MPAMKNAPALSSGLLQMVAEMKETERGMNEMGTEKDNKIPPVELVNRELKYTGTI